MDDEKLFVHSNEDIFDDIFRILYDENNGKIKPIFCLAQEKSEIELVLKLLHKRGGRKATFLPKIYQLEDLITNLHCSLKASLKSFRYLKSLVNMLYTHYVLKAT